MMINSFFTQIVMGILAVGILFFYVQPTFGNIGQIQESIALYQTEIGKVNEVNAKLANLSQQLAEVPQDDIRSLVTYLPDDTDHMAISADLLNMSVEADVYLESISSDEGIGNTAAADSLIQHTFALTIVGTYENIKLFLAKLEENNYPLEVHSLSLAASETDLMNAKLNVVTYSFNNNL